MEANNAVIVYLDFSKAFDIKSNDKLSDREIKKK